MNAWATPIGEFTTRDLAIIIWITVFLAYAFYQNETRKSFFNVIKAAFNPRLVKLWMTLILYITIVILFLYKLKFWNISLLKETVIWAILAFTCLHSTIKSKTQHTWLNSYLKTHISGLLIIEFISSSYTFGIVTEMIIITISIVIGFIVAYAENKKEFQQVYKILSFIIFSLGTGIILYALYNITIDISGFTTPKNLQQFSLPPILTVLFIPYLYTLYVYSSYERVFILISFIIKDTELQKYAKRKAIIAFKFNTNLLNRWQWLIGTKKPETKEALDSSIETINEIQYIEQNPAVIPKKDGWNHSVARQFLNEFKFHMNDYTNYYEDEWGATSDLVDVNNEILPDRVGYYIDGNKIAATQLKLILNVQDGDNSKDSDLIFMNLCNALLQIATHSHLSNKIEEAISSHLNDNETIDFYKITINFERFYSDSGYTIKFIINLTAD
ncbi:MULTISPECIES: hypothetical protein [unclassified Pseudodesulfovibrio]|uniref:hypothetical protein n=1 Tax=unclassified Pseudodesulfovibrio TaxID=2661612 RepID=UPI000FEB6FEC|nr:MULTISPECIES: hypothetical protein [unclassified Pseudodesulfovibrio]MCJ2165836.1 hypothetical protein [Pseudodesulfovibrio sp. S3-i]RWU02735.1 hypothetical protein DWB63_14440 [Pseudodesulfovibrio sp. S3]